MNPIRSRLLPIIMVLSLLSGCGFSSGIYSNYRSIEQLQLVQTMGVDSSPEEVTLCVSISAPDGSGAPIILRRNGPNFIKTMDSLQDHTSRGQLIFDHTHHIVLGTVSAKNGISGLLDLVERDVNLRMGTELFVLREGSAEVLLTSPESKEYNISDVLDSIMRDMELQGNSHVYTARSTALALSEYGAALICALRTLDTQKSRFPESEGKSVVPAGYGILRDYRLVGFLDGEDAEAVSLLRNNLGNVARAVSDGADGRIILELSRSGLKFKAHWAEDGSLAPMEIKADIGAVVAELHTRRTDILSTESVAELSRRLGEAFRQNILNVLEASQTLDADFLALRQVLRLDGGEKYYTLPEDWLQTLRFDVSVNVSIDHSYDMDDPVSKTEDEAL